MSPLEDLFAEAEAAPADTSKAKLSKLFSDAEAAPSSKSKYAGLFADEGQGQAPRGGSDGLRGLFGSGPVPNPFEFLRNVPEGLPGADAAHLAGALPGAVGDMIQRTGRAIPKLPREALLIAAQGATRAVPATELIKQQAEDIMQAQQGNPDAQARLDAKGLINSTLVGGLAAPISATAPLLTRVIAGGSAGVAQNALLAASEGRAPNLTDVGTGFVFGAIPGLGGAPQALEPIAGVRPQAVMSAETQYAAQNLLEKLKTAKPLLGVEKQLRSKELARRVGLATEAGKGLTGSARLQAQLGQLGGKLPRVDFDPLNLSDADKTQLFSHIDNLEAANQLKPFQSINARKALENLLGEAGTALPRPHEIKLLRDAFGAPFADELAKKGAAYAELNASKNLPQWRNLLKTISGTAREAKTTLDLSAPLRQGFFLTSHPREFFNAFVKMHGFARSQDVFDNAMADIKLRPSYPLMQDAGLSLTEAGGALQKGREEVFQGGLIEKLPRALGGGLFRGSQRAYTGFLNQLRADTFDDMLRQGAKLGIKPEDAAQHVANFVNAATGRGRLPGVLERNMELLSHTFFAPRLYASRVELLGTPLTYLKSLASGDKAYRFVRQQAMKDFIVAGGIATTMLSLAAAGGAKVQKDMTHGDFGKMRIGNQVVDLLGGFGQWIRAGARIQAEQKYSSQTGKKGAQGSVITRFARSKLSPIAQFATDMFLQEDFNGNKVTLPSAAWNLVSPLSLGDAVSAIQDNPETAMLTVPLSIYGAGYQKYKEPQPYQAGKRGY